MRLTFTDEQLALRGVAIALLSGICTPEHLRESEAARFSQAAWKTLDDLGLLDAAGTGDVRLVDLPVVPEPVGAITASWTDAERSRILKSFVRFKAALTGFVDDL